MTQLIRYEAALYALQEASTVDEVKDIRDQAEAVAAYARQARDTELIQRATGNQGGAERRAGQMLAEMPKNPGELVEFSPSHDGRATIQPFQAESPTTTFRWQLAGISDEEVRRGGEGCGPVTTATMLGLRNSACGAQPGENEWHPHTSSSWLRSAWRIDTGRGRQARLPTVP